MTGPGIEQCASDYAVAIRMGHGVSLAPEQALFDALVSVQLNIGADKAIDRHLATLLTELIVASWGGTTNYAGSEREKVERSITHVGEAVMAVLTPSPAALALTRRGDRSRSLRACSGSLGRRLPVKSFAIFF